MAALVLLKFCAVQAFLAFVYYAIINYYVDHPKKWRSVGCELLA